MIFWKILNKCYKGAWTIGFIETNIDGVINGQDLTTSWIKHNYKNGWFADPFILRVSDKEIIILCEEFYYPINRGRISKLVIDKNTKELLSVIPILTLDTHLSFPAILRKGDDIYIYPENYKGGGLKLYKYIEAEEKCILVKDLTNLPLTDAVITDYFGEDLCFSTYEPNPNGQDLTAYNNIENNFSKFQVVTFPSKIARNAGDFFKINGKVYRSAQDCNKEYGSGVIIQEVTKSENGDFSFSDIRRLFLTHGHFYRGCHTFNYYDGIIVTDAHGFRYHRLVKVLKFIKKFASKFKKI